MCWQISVSSISQINMVASKCSRNHFMYEREKTMKSLKLHFLQNSPLVQVWISSSDCKGVENIPGSHLWKPFQLFRRIPNDDSRITKVPSLQWWFQSWEQVKISCRQASRVWGMFHCCYIVLCSEILDQNRPVWWSIVVNDKPTVGTPFFGPFPSDGIPKLTMDVHIHFFIHSSTISLMQQFL